LVWSTTLIIGQVGLETVDVCVKKEKVVKWQQNNLTRQVAKCA